MRIPGTKTLGGGLEGAGFLGLNGVRWGKLLLHESLEIKEIGFETALGSRVLG